MRKLIIAVCVTSAACGAGGAGADSATVAADSALVAGPPAVPSTQTSPDSAAATPPSATGTSGRSTPASTPKPAQSTSSAGTGRSGTASGSNTSGTVTDTVRGIVSVVGTSFEKRVMIAESGTQRRIEVTGPRADVVRGLSGTEISVMGPMDGGKIEARSFIVRSVDGEPAIDGTLRTEGGVLYIVTLAGTRTRIVAPPPPLVGRDGSRVWITGDPAKGVSSFGFIDPAR